MNEVTCYLVVEANRTSYGWISRARIARMTKRWPTKKPRVGLVVKVTLRIPDSAFNGPEIVIDVPAQSGITGSAS